MNQQNKPLFSVLLANFNNGKYITESINSIVNQTYKNFEIIIIDDASTDDSIEIINDFKDSRIRLFSNERNQGIAFTKHRCVLEASGEICGFLDPDDALTKHAIERSVQVHLENPSASLVYSNFYFCDERLNIVSKNHTEDFPEKYKLMIGLKPNPLTSFNRNSYFETQGINPSLKRGVDRDLVLKLEEVGEVIHISDFLYYYRIHEKSISNNHNTFRSAYWAWVARFDACERRGWDKEEIYSYVMGLMEPYNHLMCVSKSTKDYRIGHFILKPLRLFKKLLK